MKVSQVDNPYFTIVAPPNAYQKVAPGVALVFRIQFRPEEQRVNRLREKENIVERMFLGLCS